MESFSLACAPLRKKPTCACHKKSAMPPARPVRAAALACAAVFLYAACVQGVAAETGKLAAVNLNTKKTALLSPPPLKKGGDHHNTSSAADAKALIAAAEAWATLSSPAGHAVDLAAGAATSRRAVVVIQGGGSTHAYTTPWASCDKPQPTYIKALAAAGFPVFTAPAHLNGMSSTDGETGCPPPLPFAMEWNALGYPTDTGAAVLDFLGFLAATYGYRTFDLVGYSYGGIVGRATIAAFKQVAAAGPPQAFSYGAYAAAVGVTIPTLLTLNTPQCVGVASFFCMAGDRSARSPSKNNKHSITASLSTKKKKNQQPGLARLRHRQGPGRRLRPGRRGVGLPVRQRLTLRPGPAGLWLP